MDRIITITLLLILTIIVTSCNNINSINQPIKQHFSGITETGELGPEPIGNIDSTDWMPRFNYDTDDSSLGRYTLSVLPVFPNPTKRYTTLRFSISAEDSIKIWLEDEFGNQSNILSKYLLIGAYHKKIDLLFDNKGNKRNSGIYRLYFRVVTRPQVPLIKGDIELQE